MKSVRVQYLEEASNELAHGLLGCAVSYTPHIRESQND